MPELPEVETVRNVLKKRILNKRIKEVNILYSKMIENNEDEFKKILIGNEFKDILRKGKWLIFELNDYYLLSHLRMEGKFFIKESKDEVQKHEHIIIRLNDGSDLRYHDTRKFGRMKLIKREELNDTEEIKKQGLEPISDDINASYLKEKLKNKRLPIKTVLLDQSIISGLGNIYVNEVLFSSKINPLKNAREINLDECEKIIKTSREILKKAIIEGGTTIKSYTSSLGVTGNYQNFLNVHKKEGLPCPNCNNKIKNIKVGGRSTYYCEYCQK